MDMISPITFQQYIDSIDSGMPDVRTRTGTYIHIKKNNQ